MNEQMTFAITLPYNVRCQLPECGKAVKRVYRLNIDGNSIDFCSTQHATIGGNRWQEKKKLNIRPGIPINNPIENDEMTGDNLLEIEGGEEE